MKCKRKPYCTCPLCETARSSPKPRTPRYEDEGQPNTTLQDLVTGDILNQPDPAPPVTKD